MPPSRKHHNRIRAGRLFNRHGFDAVSIDDVMAKAGLTRGSFYCYFASKSDLYAQSVARVVHEDKDNQKDSTSERSRAEKIVRDYLSASEETSNISDDRIAERHLTHRSRSPASLRVRAQIDDSVV